MVTSPLFYISTGYIVFSAMLNDKQAVVSDRSTLVKFADDLTLSVLIKKTQDQTPQVVENILSWAQNNTITINLTKTKEMIVKCKVERPFPTLILILNRKYFLSF